jgi:hypothetical protein
MGEKQFTIFLTDGRMVNPNIQIILVRNCAEGISLLEFICFLMIDILIPFS